MRLPKRMLNERYAAADDVHELIDPTCAHATYAERVRLHDWHLACQQRGSKYAEAMFGFVPLLRFWSNGDVEFVC